MPPSQWETAGLEYSSVVPRFIRELDRLIPRGGFAV
jgi:hypothetical protein